MKRMTIKQMIMAGGAAFAVVWSMPAAAASIVYLVNANVGPVGLITGSVTTDGTIGQLGASNFLAWNFNVQGNLASDVLTNMNSGVFAGGGAITADANNIYFNFSDPTPSFLLFQKDFSSGNSYVCVASTPFNSTPCLEGGSLVPENFQSPSAQIENFEGNQIVASISAVPEPATWAMMIVGIGMIGAVTRRRKVRATVSYA